jgi:hypothetical protein
MAKRFSLYSTETYKKEDGTDGKFSTTHGGVWDTKSNGFVGIVTNLPMPIMGKDGKLCYMFHFGTPKAKVDPFAIRKDDSADLTPPAIAPTAVSVAEEPPVDLPF